MILSFNFYLFNASTLVKSVPLVSGTYFTTRGKAIKHPGIKAMRNNTSKSNHSRNIENIIVATNITEYPIIRE